MRDFNEFNNNIKDTNLRSGIKIFEKQLNTSLETRELIVNDVPTLGIILNHLNDMNIDKEDRGLNIPISVKISRGDYVVDSKLNKIYLVMSEIDDHYYYKTCTLRECEQVLCFSFIGNPIPCIAQGESYGVKITGGTEFNTQVDTKVKVTIQSNEETRKIKPDHRFIFNHSEYGIYKIGDITVYKDGLLTFTCQKDEYMPQHDDLENNIAFNGDIKPPIDDQVKTYSIKGCPNDEMIMGKTKTFTLEPPTDGVTWVINNELSINPNVAEIVSQDTNSCVVKCNVGDDCFEIQAIKDKQVINANKKLILTARR